MWALRGGRCDHGAHSTMSGEQRGQRFRYVGWSVDRAANRLTCRYELDGVSFTEEIVVLDGGDWSSEAAHAAARLVFLLAGVSYYKTAAPPKIDLGDEPLTPTESVLLRSFYLDGLGEFAFENGLDLDDLEFVYESALPDERAKSEGSWRGAPLVPFGGGIDSIVAVELVRPVADAVLFIVNRPGDRFDAIERAAAATRLPIARAERAIDPKLLDPATSGGYMNGHVPITGIISAIALLAAALQERDAVVMSNEWSASAGTLQHRGRWINHQYSKGIEFESILRDVVHESISPDLEYFSRLRPYSELWIAQRFAELTEYRSAFHSCNRAFASDPTKRLDHWCGVCPKCCFIDLILAPFLEPAALAEIFGGREPLADTSLREVFDGLVATSSAFKPFECVGDVEESRTAVVMAGRRADRVGFPLLQDLARAVAGDGDTNSDDESFFRPMTPHFVPDSYAADDLLV